MGGGKPAARQGDMTRKGLDIVQGSASVTFPIVILTCPLQPYQSVGERSKGLQVKEPLHNSISSVIVLERV